MKLRNKSGITLISLVVTILVLIILASITIGTLSGENGIIVSAENARNVALDSGKLENNTLLSYENLIDSSINFNVIGGSGDENNNAGDDSSEENDNSEGDDSEETPEVHVCNYNIFYSSIASTCVTQGSETYKCSECGNTQTTELAIDTNNHTGETKEECVYVDDTYHSINTLCSDCLAVLSSKTNTHTNDGSGTCSDCLHDITSNHTHSYTVFVEQVSVATCIAQAQNKYECSVCGVTTTISEGDLLDHTWNEGEVITEPTTTTEGVTTYTCTVTGCDATKTELIEKLPAYLVEVVEIGDYVDIGIDYTNQQTFYSSYVSGTYDSTGPTGWRVLSKSGSGASGIVTLVSAGTPLTFYHPGGNYSESSLEYLADLNTEITLVSSGQGFRANGLSSEDLASVWSSNSRINTSAGVHALTTSEVETAYAAITGVTKTIIELFSTSCVLQPSYKQTAATGAGNTMSTKANDLLGIGMNYRLGGSSPDVSNMWFVNFEGGVGASISSTMGVRPVLNLNSGVQINSTNVGDGSSVSLAYTLN